MCCTLTDFDQLQGALVLPHVLPVQLAAHALNGSLGQHAPQHRLVLGPGIWRRGMGPAVRVIHAMPHTARSHAECASHQLSSTANSRMPRMTDATTTAMISGTFQSGSQPFDIQMYSSHCAAVREAMVALLELAEGSLE